MSESATRTPVSAPSNAIRRSCVLVSLALCATAVVAAVDQDVSPGQSSPRRGDGPLVTVRTPQPEQFELAMDEVDVEADRTAGATDAPPAPRAVPSTAIMTSSEGRATLRVSGASSTQDLLSISVALEAANPGSRVSWVLYPPAVTSDRFDARAVDERSGPPSGRQRSECSGGLEEPEGRPRRAERIRGRGKRSAVGAGSRRNTA